MKIDLLIIVSNPDAGAIITPLARACRHAGIKWAAFFTNDGVTTLDDESLVKELKYNDKLAVCQESWELHMNDKLCPLTLGSQTINSAWVSQSDRVLSL